MLLVLFEPSKQLWWLIIPFLSLVSLWGWHWVTVNSHQTNQIKGVSGQIRTTYLRRLVTPKCGLVRDGHPKMPWSFRFRNYSIICPEGYWTPQKTTLDVLLLVQKFPKGVVTKIPWNQIKGVCCSFDFINLLAFQWPVDWPTRGSEVGESFFTTKNHPDMTSSPFHPGTKRLNTHDIFWRSKNLEKTNLRHQRLNGQCLKLVDEKSQKNPAMDLT